MISIFLHIRQTKMLPLSTANANNYFWSTSVQNQDRRVRRLGSKNFWAPVGLRRSINEAARRTWRVQNLRNDAEETRRQAAKEFASNQEEKGEEYKEEEVSGPQKKQNQKYRACNHCFAKYFVKDVAKDFAQSFATNSWTSTNIAWVRVMARFVTVFAKSFAEYFAQTFAKALAKHCAPVQEKARGHFGKTCGKTLTQCACCWIETIVAEGIGPVLLLVFSLSMVYRWLLTDASNVERERPSPLAKMLKWCCVGQVKWLKKGWRFFQFSKDPNEPACSIFAM